jgi:hypothetical protein
MLLNKCSVRSALHAAFVAFVVGVAGVMDANPSEAQNKTVPSAVPAQEIEAFRLQVANSAQGAVELSTDGGKTWLLVARVARPALVVGAGAQSSAPEVQSSGNEGFTVGAGAGKLIWFVPDSILNEKNKGAILVNVPSTSALFKDFMPAMGSKVHQVVNKSPTEGFTASPYAPKDGDVLQVWSPRSANPRDKLAEYAQDAARYYRERAVARLRAIGRKPTSGLLTVTARLRPGDEPSAVTFLLDGAVSGIMNHSPFTMHFDTREWVNGEHAVEVRALNAAGIIISRTRTLVVVENSAQSP